MVWRSQSCLVWNPTKSGTQSHQLTSTVDSACWAGLAVLVGWWLRVPDFVGFQTKQIWDIQTMLYHPAKVPSLVLTLSLDSSRPYCAFQHSFYPCLPCPPKTLNKPLAWIVILGDNNNFFLQKFTNQFFTPPNHCATTVYNNLAYYNLLQSILNLQNYISIWWG